MGHSMGITKSSEQILSESYGVEFEEDSYYSVSNSISGKDYSELRREILLQKDQYAIDYICKLIATEYLDLSPEFQRNEVWQDVKKRSLFIESILLNIPIPIFYAYSNDDERLSIIDGKQRLSTIRDFSKNKFSLSHLHHLAQFNGMTYAELPEKVRSNFDRYQCSFYVLNYRTPKRYIFDIFMRINTGSMPLTTQEIRNIFAKPKVRDLLKKMSTCTSFRKVTRSKINDIRMDAQELALRFIALKKNYNFNNETLCFNESSLSELLDRTIGELNETPDIELASYLTDYKIACDRTYELLQERACSRLKMYGNKIVVRSQTINKSLFSVFSVLLSDDKYAGISLRKYTNKVINELYPLQDKGALAQILSSGTGSKNNISNLFYYISTLLGDNIYVN